MGTLGLSMIVKNEAEFLPRCLASVREIVTEMVIADTGSSDGTCDIARSFGASVLSLPWRDDYAWARNAALQRIHTEWVLVLDADEEVDPDTAKNIGGLLAEENGGYIVPIRNYVPLWSNRAWDRIAVRNDNTHPRAKEAPAFILNENCRLFRRRDDIYFTGCVHEVVEPQISAAGLTIALANFFIHHFGHLERRSSAVDKAAYYGALLRKKTRETPSDPWAWIQLGLYKYQQSSDPDAAEACLKRALNLDSGMAEVFLFLGLMYVRQRRYREALEVIERDKRSGISAALREETRGDALMGLDRLSDARVAYARALELSRSNPLIESKLGYVEVRLGNRFGLKRLAGAATLVPDILQVQERLIKAHVLLGELDEAVMIAQRWAENATHPRPFLVAASLYASLGERERCLQTLERGMHSFPSSQEIQNSYQRVKKSVPARVSDGCGL